MILEPSVGTVGRCGPRWRPDQVRNCGWSGFWWIRPVPRLVRSSLVRSEPLGPRLVPVQPAWFVPRLAQSDPPGSFRGWSDPFRLDRSEPEPVQAVCPKLNCPWTPGNPHKSLMSSIIWNSELAFLFYWPPAYVFDTRFDEFRILGLTIK